VRYTPKGSYQQITMYRSEVCLKNLNPKWTEWELDLAEIGGLDEPFTIEVFDWDKDGDHGRRYRNIFVTARSYRIIDNHCSRVDFWILSTRIAL
jgi:hypothetical protein